MDKHDQDDRQTAALHGAAAAPSPSRSAGGISWPLAGLGAAAPARPDRPAVAGPFEEKDFEQLVPRDKKLNPDWVRG